MSEDSLDKNPGSGDEMKQARSYKELDAEATSYKAEHPEEVSLNASTDTELAWLQAHGTRDNEEKIKAIREEAHQVMERMGDPVNGLDIDEAESKLSSLQGNASLERALANDASKLIKDQRDQFKNL